MEKSILIQCCIMVVLYSSTVTALTCYNGENTTCVPPFNLFPGCRIYIQNDFLFQACTYLVGNTCDGRLVVGQPGEVISYEICCTTDLCNSQEIFYSAIDALTSPNTSTTSIPIMATTTTSIMPTSTLSSISTSSLSSPTTSYLMQTSSSSIIVTTPSSSASYTTSSSVPDGNQDSISIGSQPPDYVIGIVCVLVAAIFILIIIIALGIFCHFRQRHVVGIAVPTESDGTPTLSTSGEFSNDPMECTTSGSGSGLPLLIQRSVAAQVTLHNLVGKGRFGEVWKGSYRGDDIAVKIFHTKEEASWFHEVDIYQTCLIRHPNILRFVAADNKDIGMATQLWLITEFCELGSLYELLQNEELDESIMLKVLCTAASGLAHLHAEITGTEGKPGIAHRDLKTRNLLVKSDYTCCVADLGLALRYDKAADKIEELSTKRVGTRRYLSPEILDNSMDSRNFDCFKRSDMYSFGLVMWEVTRRGLCAGHAEEYQLPYFELLTPDPSFEEVKRVVSDEQKRPGIPNRWSQSEIFNSLTQIMEQCWHNNSEARLTALRVKKNLTNLQSSQGKIKDNK